MKKIIIPGVAALGAVAVQLLTELNFLVVLELVEGHLPKILAAFGVTAVTADGIRNKFSGVKVMLASIVVVFGKVGCKNPSCYKQNHLKKSKTPAKVTVTNSRVKKK